MRLIIIFASALVAVCCGLLLDSKDPSTYITAKEFRDLMDLVFEEKHYRREIEHNVGSMLQEADNYKAALTQLGNNYHSLSMGYRHLIDSHTDMKRGLQNLKQVNHTVQITMSNISADIAVLKQKSGHTSGFTAYNPSSTHPTGNVVFSTVLSNIGNDYSSSTGAFTCQYPGIYMFTTHLYNSPSSSYDYVSCYILLNGSSLIATYSYPYSDTYYYKASNSLIRHLNQGDVVTVGSCSSSTGLYSYSSFSGYLVRAD